MKRWISCSKQRAWTCKIPAPSDKLVWIKEVSKPINSRNFFHALCNYRIYVHRDPNCFLCLRVFVIWIVLRIIYVRKWEWWFIMTKGRKMFYKWLWLSFMDPDSLSSVQKVVVLLQIIVKQVLQLSLSPSLSLVTPSLSLPSSLSSLSSSLSTPPSPAAPQRSHLAA